MWLPDSSRKDSLDRCLVFGHVRGEMFPLTAGLAGLSRSSCRQRPSAVAQGEWQLHGCTERAPAIPYACGIFVGGYTYRAKGVVRGSGCGVVLCGVGGRWGW